MDHSAQSPVSSASLRARCVGLEGQAFQRVDESWAAGLFDRSSGWCKDVAQCLTCIKSLRAASTPLLPRQCSRRSIAERHRDWSARAARAPPSPRRRYHCTDLVTEDCASTSMARCMSDDAASLFDDKNTHRSSDGGKRYRQLNADDPTSAVQFQPGRQVVWSGLGPCPLSETVNFRAGPVGRAM